MMLLWVSKPEKPPLRVLNLSWGVQSWTSAAMVAHGEMERPHLILFVDTAWESKATYNFSGRWWDWLVDQGLPVSVSTSSVTQASVQLMNPRSGQTHIPAFTLHKKDRSEGRLRRSCTGRWKIEPARWLISAALKELGWPKSPGIVEQWISYTTDEAQRMKWSDVKYIDLRYPLIDLGLHRTHCISWLESKGLEVPPKSACVFCPNRSKQAWHDILSNGDPYHDLRIIITVDTILRNKRPGYLCYLNRERVPVMEQSCSPTNQTVLWE